MRKQIVGLSIVTSLMLVGCGSDSYNAFPEQPQTVAEMVGKEKVVGWENYKDDSDGDKVPDYKDKCPNTPKGAGVDENGCVLDIDSDGVADYKDKCPNTKPNMEVNENGCYVDTDKDGVADYKDKCQDTPKNIEVDNYGCAIDMDKDGVADYKDKCLSTPKGAEVGINGCALDSDKDGIPNGLDKCANTPKNAPIDKKGCALDSDNDGVINLFDKCPDTLKELEVDVDGCPVDSDNDGIPNYKDKCPNTPSDVKVDFKGCPVIAEYRFHFNTNSFTIAPKYYKQVETLVKVLQNNKDIKIEIEGFTDNKGTYIYNKELSLKRANALRTILIKKYTIMPNRIEVIGYGLDNPIADNSTEEGRAKNRRIVVIDKSNFIQNCPEKPVDIPLDKLEKIEKPTKKITTKKLEKSTKTKKNGKKELSKAQVKL